MAQLIILFMFQTIYMQKGCAQDLITNTQLHIVGYGMTANVLNNK